MCVCMCVYVCKHVTNIHMHALAGSMHTLACGIFFFFRKVRRECPMRKMSDKCCVYRL